MQRASILLAGIVTLAALPGWTQDEAGPGETPQAAPKVVAAPAQGEGPNGGAFTFKRIGLPQGGGSRITVQIDPEAQAEWFYGRDPAKDVEIVDASAALPLGPMTGFEWFWESISPAIDGSGPANVNAAIDLLNNREGLTTPRIQPLQDIAAAHGADILAATVGTNVSPALVLALISVESSGRTSALSEKGAQGLMQLIPDTASRFGVEDSNDPSQNIKGGVAYLAWLMEEFGNDPILTLAGYNAGENAVLKNGGVPPYPETRAYVPKVLNAWRVARGLCLTPPELLTDGCVFAVRGTSSNG